MGEEVITMAEIGASSYRRFLAGDQTALEELICAYSDSLVRFAYGYVRDSGAAEDVAAEAMAIFLLKSRHFPDEARMLAYLYKIARTKSMDYLRLHKREVPLEDVENVLGSGDPEADLLTRERDAAIYRSLQTLPVQYRQVLELAYFDGFSVTEICTVMGKSDKQVYNLLARARIALRKILEKEGITHEDL